MSGEERAWTEDAISQCKRASEKGVIVLLVRRQDVNGEADVVVTNATGGDAIAALSRAIEYDGQDSEE